MQCQLGTAHLASHQFQPDPSEGIATRNTAFMAANATGENHLQAKGTKLSLQVLADPATSANSFRTQTMPKHLCANSCLARQEQPELKHLQDRLRQQLYSGVCDGGRYLPANLPLPGPELNKVLADMTLDDQITSINGGGVVALPEWLEEGALGEGALQTVRASRKLYGSERFEFVSLQRPERPSRSYAQIRLLFKATSKVRTDGCILSNSMSAEPETRDYAFLQVFEDASANAYDKLAAAGCKRIKYDTRNNKAWYEVVPLADLCSREFVTPISNEQGVFHVSCFLPN